MSNKVKFISIIVSIILFWVLIVLVQILIIGNKNLYAREADTVLEAESSLKEMNLNNSNKFSKKDFYGEYIPKTNFIITYKDKVYYDQGYYMVYKDNYKTVYCIDPMSTAWTLKNKDDLENYNNNEYEQLSDVQKKDVNQISYTAQNLFNQTKDPKYLVAGQLLVWESIGATLNQYSDNLQSDMDDIENQKNNTTISSKDMLYYDTAGQDLVSPKPDKPEIQNPQEKVSVEKTSSVDGELVQDGDQISYKITAVNNSDITEDITITDELKDSNLSFNENENIIINGQKSEYTISDLQKGITLKNVAPRDTVVIEYNATVEKNAQYESGTGISNTVSACINENKCDTDINEIDVKEESGVNIAKKIYDADGDDVASPGEELTFEISVQNVGKDMSNILVKDELNDSYIKYDLSQIVEINGQESEYTVSDLQDGILINNVKAGEVNKISFKASVVDDYNVEDNNGKVSISNTASACIENICQTSTAEIPITGFELEKTVIDENENGIADENEKLTYNFKITNESDKNHDFRLVDELSTNNTVIDENQELNIESSKKTTPKNATIGDLENGVVVKNVHPGETVNISFTINTSSNIEINGDEIPNNYLNNVVTACTEESECESDAATIPFANGHALRKDGGIQKMITDENGDGIAQVGEKLTFTVILANGTSSPEEISVFDTFEDKNIKYDLSDNLNIVSGEGSDGGEFVTPNKPVVRDLEKGVTASVQPHSSFSFEYTGMVKDPLSNTNNAEVYNNIALCTNQKSCITDGETIPLEYLTDFDIEKEVEDANGNNLAESGEVLNYKITIVNSGNTTEDANVVDYLPNNNFAVNENDSLVIESDENVSTSVNNPTIKDLISEDGITFSNVQPGQTITIEFSGTVADPISNLNSEINHITNTVNLCYDKNDDDFCEGDAAVITTNKDKPAPKPDNFGAEKLINDENGNNIIEPGEKIQYDIMLTNADKEAEKFYLTDPLDDSNIEYNKDEELSIDDTTKAHFIGGHTVGDLKKGVELEIQGNSTVHLKYSGTVRNPLKDPNAVISYNTVEMCNESKEQCTDGGDEDNVVKKTDFKIVKSAAVNDDYNQTTIQEGDKVHYKIQITNTGNEQISNLHLTDSRAKELFVDPESDITFSSKLGNSVSTKPINPKGSDLDTGITIKNIEIGDTITVEYDSIANLKDSEFDSQFNNVATVCIDDKEKTCHSGNAVLTNNSEDYPVENEDIAILKNITDENGDGIASEGENLQFKIILSNEGNETENVTLKDKLSDTNIDYDLENKLDITPNNVEYNPKPATIGDLKSGIEISIPPRSQIEVGFNAPLKTEAQGLDTTATTIYNMATICDQKDECTSSTAEITPENKAGFDIEKDVLVNGEDTSQTQAVKSGDVLDYTITITNTQNTPLVDLKITDMEDKEIITNLDDKLSLQTTTGENIKYSPKNATTADLFNDGIIINEPIMPGESIELKYSGIVSSNVANIQYNHLANIATGTVDNPLKSSSSDINGELTASDNAVVTINQENLVPNNEISILKNIEEINTPDGIASPSEELKFTIVINNSGDNSQVVKVKDSLDDVNMKYDLSQTIDVLPSKAEINPSSPTLRDLKNGLDVTVPAGQNVTLEFTAKVQDSLKDETKLQVENNVDACIDDSCTDSGNSIPLEGFKGFKVNKSAEVLDGDDTNDSSFTKIGDEIKYTISIQNVKNEDIKNIKVTDVHDDNIVVPTQELSINSNLGTVDYEPNPATTDNLLSSDGIILDTLHVGEMITLEYTANVVDTFVPEENTYITNVATALATDDNISSNDSEILTTDENNIPPDNGLAVVKSIEEPAETEDEVASLGEDLTFNIQVSNSTLKDKQIKVVDELADENIKYDLNQSLVFTPEVDGLSPVDATVGDLVQGIEFIIPADSSVNISFTAPVKNKLVDETKSQILNEVLVCDKNDKCVSGEANLPLPNTQGFDLTKEVIEDSSVDPENDKVIVPGEKLTYQIKIINNRNNNLQNIKIEDDHDKEIKFDPQEQLYIESTMIDNPDNDNQKEYTVEDLMSGDVVLQQLRVGEEITITYHARASIDILNQVNDQFTNFITACSDSNLKDQSSETENGLCANASATVTTNSTVKLNDIGITKNIVDGNQIDGSTYNNGVAERGEEIHYEVNIINNGSKSHEIKIKDALDDKNMDYDLNNEVKVTPISKTFTDSNGNILDTVLLKNLQEGITTDIAPGEKITLDYSGIVKDPLAAPTNKNIENLVEVSDAKKDIYSNGGASITLEDNPDFAVSKVATTPSGNGIVKNQDSVLYTVTVENTGNQVIKDLIFTDNIDNNLKYDSKSLVKVNSESTQKNVKLTGVSDGNTSPTLEDLFDKGINISRIDPGQTVVIEYMATVDLDDGEETAEAEDTSTLTNNVKVCKDIKEKGSASIDGNEACAIDSAKVTTDPNIPDNPNISILKKITDEDANGISNDIAEVGDILTFTIDLSNLTNEDTVVTLTDELKDPNLDYDINDSGDTSDEEVSIETPGSFVDTSRRYVEYLPKRKGGIEISLPKNSTTRVTFQAKVDEPYQDTTQKFIKNIATACSDETDSTTCTSSGDSIKISENKHVEIEKKAKVNKDNVVTKGQQFEYQIDFKNTGNIRTDLYIKDDFPSYLLNVNEDQIVQMESYTTEPNSPVVGDLIGDEDNGYENGIVVKDVEPGGKVEISFLVNVKNSLDINGEDYLGNITNTVEICTRNSKINQKSEECDNSSATVTTDPDTPIVDGLGVQKFITDPINEETEDFSNNNDHISQPGERLRFNFEIVNSGEVDQKYIVKDSLLDPNIDYDSESEQKLKIVSGDGTFVTPVDPTVSDLKQGITINVPAGEKIEIEFYANVLESLKEKYNAQITNEIQVCLKNDTKCSNAEGIINLPKYSRLNINKEYSTNSSYTNEDGDTIDYIDSAGDTINYNITIENNGTEAIDNFIIKDDIDEDYLVNPKEIDVIINDDSGNQIGKYTGEDLMNGITYDSGLNPGEYITVNFSVLTSEKIEDVLKDGAYLSNTAIVSYTSSFTNEEENLTSGTETPYIKHPNLNNPSVDDDFIINKEIEDSDGDGIISEGEKLTMHIQVTNSAEISDLYESTVPPSTYNVTDDLTDKNLNYEVVMNQNVQITNISTGEPVEYTPDPATVKDLDKKNGTGINIIVPDGETVEISFTVNANTVFK